MTIPRVKLTRPKKIKPAGGGNRGYDSDAYKKFRLAVKCRDGFRCCLCEQKFGFTDLIVHHLRKWASNATLRFDVKNGVTLCYACHKKVTGNEDLYIPLFILKTTNNQKARDAKDAEKNAKNNNKETGPDTV